MANFDLDTWTTVARRLTEAAARACTPWIGEGKKDAADAAAVDALRNRLADAPGRGRIVIGEGEKDDAPYLAPGSTVGAATSPVLDIAVDPLEGTRLVAEARPGALSVLALAPAKTLLPLGRAFYMEKLIGPPSVDAALDLDASPAAVVHGVAEAQQISVAEVRVAVQERSRHAGLVDAIRDAGAQVHVFGEGDLSFALLALRERGDGKARTRTTDVPIDLLWGIGGAPEGMLAAAAQRVVGGAMRLRLAPRSETERVRLGDDPALPDVLGRTFTARDLVRTDTVVMALTGVTDGPLLDGIRQNETGHPDTLLLTPRDGVQRRSTAS
jgi:fructose-1,6-bisphosphatase II